MKKRGQVNIPICLAGILFCLTLFSIHLTSGLYAKYMAKSGSEDSARVAQMAAGTEVVIDEQIMIAPGETQDIYFNVTNKNEGAVCEVALQYEISIELIEENLPLEWKLYTGAGFTDEAQYGGELGAQVETTIPYCLKISWPNEKNNVAYAFEIDVLRITVKAEQID